MLNLAIFFVMSLCIHYGVLLLLRRIKGYQNIYELSPTSHQEKKNTPSFGGVGILLSAIAGMLYLNVLHPGVYWCIALMLSFGVLGFMDDGLAKLRKKNMGLRASHKFMLQVGVAAAFVWSFHIQIMPLSLLTMAFYVFIIVGSSNATNLTDGLDGLLGGLVFISLLGFMILAIPLGSSSLLMFIQMMMVIMVAFLCFNTYPAKCFMGDTGSLALGALLAGLSMLYGNPWVLLPLGTIYIIETVSVMIQVLWYKRTKTRVFLMAPLHHHFELLGLHERHVVRLFWGVQLVIVLIVFLPTL